MLLAIAILIAVGVLGVALLHHPIFITFFVVAIFSSIGFFFVYPNGRAGVLKKQPTKQ